MVFMTAPLVLLFELCRRRLERWSDDQLERTGDNEGAGLDPSLVIDSLVAREDTTCSLVFLIASNDA